MLLIGLVWLPNLDFDTWFRILDGFFTFVFFHIGSNTSSFGCEEPIEINILGICIELKEPDYVILKLQK